MTAGRPPARLAVLDAPSNLGLRPPAPGTVPGCYKLAGALRDQGLVARLGARDAGYVVPPRYDRGDWKPGDGVFNAAAMAEYTAKLADRITRVLDNGEFLVLLGGDCSILLGPVLALRRRGRYGLAYFDGSADFRHTGNSDHVGAAGGEGTALVTGRGQPDLTDIDGLRPYVRDADLAVLGIRDYDVHLADLAEAGIANWTAPAIREQTPAAVAGQVLQRFERLDGFFVHTDVDVLDPSIMPAVDAPDPGGLTYAELTGLLRPLVAAPGCVGLEITIFDPDLDPDGKLATELTDRLVAALGR
ncbi:arginase family protein [Flindersiella endophytica]